MKGRQKTEDYIRILSSRALKIIELNLGKDFIFQQDNCPIHKSALAKKFFKDSKVTLLDWPPYSPDLNLIENVWAILSQEIYGSGTIKNLKELEYKLKLAITNFNETKGSVTENLYKSIPARLCEVLQCHGERIKY